jgi:3',5'-cyclic AMP phosphodiesterase CpdA
MFVLAHLSDPHLAPLPRPRARELAGKRVLGFLNWRRKRRAIHRPEVLEALLADLANAAADHVVVTGDLVNIALTDEFALAAQWLARLGPSERVTFVPGNHDAYVRAAAGDPARHWGGYMRGDDAPPSTQATSDFPFVRRRGPVALIGVSSAVPTAPFMATGLVGADQLARLAEILDSLGREDLLRVVLIHHPPVTLPRSRFKRLVDAQGLRDVIARHGAGLVLHGHAHVRSLVWLDGPDGRVPSIGVPSASAAPYDGVDPAAYNLYRIERDKNGWRIEMISRGLTEGGFAEVGRETLLVSRFRSSPTLAAHPMRTSESKGH